MERRTLLQGVAMQTGRTALRYEVWDVFTDRAFGGNPLAVFFGGDGLKDEQRFALAREMNHSETTFVGADGKVRIFTATQELPFAGHPVLGTAFAMRRGKAGLKEVVVRVPQGPIPVVFDGEMGVMTQQDPVFAETHEAGTLAPMLGVAVGEMDANYPIVNVSTGRPNLIVVLKSRAAMEKVSFDWRQLTEYLAKGDKQRGIYLLTRDTIDGGAKLHARKLTARLEDPATGSAAGCAAAYAVKYGLIRSGERVRMEQGHLMGRPSLLLIGATKGAGEQIGKVEVGGSSVLVLEGTVAAR